jgi:uncharacterized protein (DUF1684 family)
MKYFLLLMITFCTLTSCAQNKETIIGETEFQKTLNAEFKDVTKSPLISKDLKEFESLDFFAFDESFIVKAHLTLTPNSAYVKMPTTTVRISEERVYGILTFNLQGKTYKLNVYQNKYLQLQKGYEDYLFLPFIDNTNGETTYGGGRYLDLRIPKNDTVLLDLNKAYNPYCAYNPKYSCPIVPIENTLDLKVEAGVKAFSGH